MKDDYNKYKRWELIIMITILKTLRFCNSKVGEFILSFILIATPSFLLLGTSIVVWLIVLITHFISILTVGRLRSDKEKRELDDELKVEIKSCKLALKNKNK